MSFYTTSLGPPVGDSTAMYAPPLRYKRGALAAHTRPSRDSALDTPRLSQHKLGFTTNNPTLNLLIAQAIQHTVDVGYYAPAVRTTLNPLCSSCSSTEIALRHPAVGLHTTTEVIVDAFCDQYMIWCFSGRFVLQF